MVVPTKHATRVQQRAMKIFVRNFDCFSGSYKGPNKILLQNALFFDWQKTTFVPAFKEVLKTLILNI